MKLRVGDDWRSVYDVLPLDDLGIEPLLAQFRNTATAGQHRHLLMADDDQQERLKV
jgi:hypothetical protein